MATHSLYSEHAGTIESVLTNIRRAQRLSADDGDEFSSWARVRLLEDDCAILRKWSGLATFRGFIAVVLNNLFLDWRNREWGKWRPTTQARRLGRIAVELERLVLRDGYDYGQSAQLLISKGIAASERECDAVWSQLRRSGYRRRVAADALNDLPSASEHDPLAAAERRDVKQRALTAMNEAIASLPAQDQLIVKLRHHDGVTVSRIAKLIDVDQKRLYRRFEQIQQQLKSAIIAAGISEEDVHELFVSVDPGDDDDPSGAGPGNGGDGPSVLSNVREAGYERTTQGEHRTRIAGGVHRAAPLSRAARRG